MQALSKEGFLREAQIQQGQKLEEFENFGIYSYNKH